MKNQFQWRKFDFEGKMSNDSTFVSYIIKNIKGMKKYKVIDHELLSFNHDNKLVIKLIL